MYKKVDIFGRECLVLLPVLPFSMFSHVLFLNPRVLYFSSTDGNAANSLSCLKENPPLLLVDLLNSLPRWPFDYLPPNWTYLIAHVCPCQHVTFLSG